VIAFYASQNDFKIDGLLGKLKESFDKSPVQRKFMQNLFRSLARMSFAKKLRESID
jgi:hypothetical protein